MDEYTEEVSIDNALSEEQERINIDDLDEYLDWYDYTLHKVGRISLKLFGKRI